MHSKASQRNETLDAGGGREQRRSARQYQTSRFAKEKVEGENPIRLPSQDLLREFVENDGRESIVQAKTSRDNLRPCSRKTECEEAELVKYMSKVPGYLHTGDDIQGNILNFGVLDWRRLEKWTHKPNKTSASEKACKEKTGSCSNSASDLSHEEVQSYNSVTKPVIEVASPPVAKPLCGKELHYPDVSASSNCLLHENTVKLGETQIEDYDDDLNTRKGKKKNMERRKTYHRKASSMNKTSIPICETENIAEDLKGLGLDTYDQDFQGKQENIVLLLPKDFSRPGSSEMAPPRTSLGERSADLNWSSFSDIFSFDEIQSDDTFSDFSNSCSLPCALENETELDIKLYSLIESQRFDPQVNLPDAESQSPGSRTKVEEISSNILKECSGLHQRPPHSSETTSGSKSQRFSFSLERLTRSLSFKEGSTHSQLRSSYVAAKSGPADSESFSAYEAANSGKPNPSRKMRNSPLKRFLDPLWKTRVVSQMKENPSDTRMDSSTAVPVSDIVNNGSATVKAFLHLTLKSGLPLFKFMVETNHDVLASTVKSVTAFGKDHDTLLYTFYSVNKVKKKTGGWKNPKGRTSGFSYNIIGQMKFTCPRFPSWEEPKSVSRYMVKESVLYSVDLSKGDAAISEPMTSRELAAIVVRIPSETGAKGASNFEHLLSEGFANCVEDEICSNTVVILPGGLHSLPHEGVPSSLIKRWKSGGSCDCGGWDVGCRLKILTNQMQDKKNLVKCRSLSMQVPCDLFEQGEAKQVGPIFRIFPLRDDLFSVEFDATISPLQAFSICVGIINSHKLTDPLDYELERLGIQSPHPPHSPAGRV